jgi:FtsP/CotA-like multicopper oxidase with cupredoxin domain
MRSLSFLRPLRWGAVLVAIVTLVAVGLTPSPSRAQMMSGMDGLVCTMNPSATFTLTARAGRIILSDANTMYMWGFAAGDGPFQYPGPVLCVMQGQTVTIVLHNTLPEPVSIVFPGQADVLADGSPAMPVYDGLGNLTSLVKPAAANGGSVTYSFVAAEPGTYLYESGTNPALQVQMGLAGVLVVRPMMGDDYAYNDAATRFNPDAEFMWFFNELDPLLHQAVERGEPYDMANYFPRYFLLNGRGLPDTMAPNNVSWLPSQPYGALVRIHPYDPVNNPLPALIRVVGLGTEDYPMHTHGNFTRVIARDGRLLQGTAGEDLSYQEFTVEVVPGQTQDLLYTWEDANLWDPVTNPVPVPLPQQQDQTWGMYYSGSPYLGTTNPFMPGEMTYNQCGEYYIIAHNHALHQITSWGGLTMSGQATFIRVDPPLPNNCP